MHGLRIIIADSDAGFRKKLKEKLTRVGYNVIADIEDSQRALQLIFNTQPDLVIVDYNLPKRGGLEVAKIVEEQGIAPTILLSSYAEQDSVLETTKVSFITGYLVKPFDELNLVPAIQLAISNFKKNSLLQEEIRKLKKDIENKAYIDKAKRFIMKEHGWTEEEAHRYLQKLSMDNSASVVTIAKRVINGMYTI